MTKTKREGRPPRRIQALHTFEAWDNLCVQFPAVAELHARAQYGCLTSVELEELIDATCREITCSTSLKPPSPEPGPSTEERLLWASENYQSAAQQLAITRAIQSVVETARCQAEALVQQWKDTMLAAALAPPKRDAYIIDTAGRILEAAGLTTPISRRLTAQQIQRISTILTENDVAPNPPMSIPRGQIAIKMDWRPDNPWASLFKEIPGYRLTERLVTPREEGFQAVIAVGLPPFTDLADFGLELAYAAFKHASTNHAKARECWKLLDKWLQANRVTGCLDFATARLRKEAWVFMFACRYGFADGVEAFQKVRLPSPSRQNSVIVAERA